MWMLAAVLLCICPPVDAARRDVIVMKNGDRFTGEIKKLDKGQLYVDLEYVAGKTIALDWLEVERLETTARWRVGLDDGTRMTGLIDKVPANEAPGEDFRIEEAGSKAQVSGPEVVEISLQKQSFWRQLKGSVNLGQSYTSGNSQSQLDVTANAQYVTTNYLAQGQFSSSISGAPGAEKTQRFELSFAGGRFLSRNSLLFGVADFLTSTQQSLDLRTTLGGAYGRYIKRTNRTELLPFAGLAFTRERYDPSAGLDPNQQSVEGLLGVNYTTAQFNKVLFKNAVQVYPSISNAGRIRASVNSSLTLKLSHGFDLTFGFWDDFDSKPPVNAKRNELGVSTTFGISF
jgi:putative salt-induced outer membrane protein YdiY